MSLQAFILDLDGVLTNTAEYHFQAWLRLAEEEQVSFDREINEQLRGVSRRRSLEVLLGNALPRYSEDQIQAMMARKNTYYQEMLQQITSDDFLPRARQLLDDLRAHGLKIAIGSASKNTRLVLERLGILKAFDGIADGNSVTRSKPAPDIFLHAAKLLNTPPAQCVVVEDAESGIAAALAAKMFAVGIGPATRVGAAHLRYPDTAALDLEEIITTFEQQQR
jgi:beta-phosphoglucomutase